MDIKIRARVVATALFLLSSALGASTIKVAVLDTGFCLPQAPSTSIVFHREVDASLTLGDYCKTATSKRLHGQKVVNKLLRSLSPTQKAAIEIYPIVVFDRQGYASIESFARALKTAKELNVDYLLLSVALPLEKNTNPLPLLPATTFVASGRAERQITAETILWPHHFNDPKMIIVGGLSRGVKDPKALYPTKIKLFFEGSSSLANAAALAAHLGGL